MSADWVLRIFNIISYLGWDTVFLLVWHCPRQLDPLKYITFTENKLLLHLWKAVSLTRSKKTTDNKNVFGCEILRNHYFAIFCNFILKPGCCTLIVLLTCNLETNKINKYTNLKKCSYYFYFFRLLFLVSVLPSTFLRCLFIFPMPLCLYLLFSWPVFHEPDV